MLSSLLSRFAVYPPTCPNHALFGLIPWYHYLPTADFMGQHGITCSVMVFTFLPTGGYPSDIPLVLLAVVDDLLRIAGLIAVAFIIYGGYQYVSSQGQPERTSRAQNTITDALIGVAIAVTAITAVTFLGNKLGGS
jgi:Flp pilus assembly pilin Flp